MEDDDDTLTQTSAPTPIKAPAPVLGSGATLAEVLALAPAARAWLATGGVATPADIALALDLGARLLQATSQAPPSAANPPVPPPRETSAARGARGEDEVFDLIARSRRVRDMTRRAHSGDFVCDSATGPVLVEVKNYTSAVPSAEVEKFLRDLRERDAAAGVLLSLASPIAGHRMSFVILLEPRVSAGCLVPVVLASPPRSVEGARLAAEVALAAVDVAACLAEVYPRGVRGAHGRDTLHAFSIAADQISDGIGSIRADLVRTITAASEATAGLSGRLMTLGREVRELARAQRAEIEDKAVLTVSVERGRADLLLAELRGKYDIVASADLVRRVLERIETASLAAGYVGALNNWQFLKTRAVHPFSRCGISFLKRGTEVIIPLDRPDKDALAGLFKTHAKKTRVATGDLSIELDATTVETILDLLPF